MTLRNRDNSLHFKKTIIAVERGRLPEEKLGNQVSTGFSFAFYWLKGKRDFSVSATVLSYAN